MRSDSLLALNQRIQLLKDEGASIQETIEAVQQCLHSCSLPRATSYVLRFSPWHDTKEALQILEGLPSFGEVYKRYYAVYQLAQQEHCPQEILENREQLQEEAIHFYWTTVENSVDQQLVADIYEATNRRDWVKLELLSWIFWNYRNGEDITECVCYVIEALLEYASPDPGVHEKEQECSPGRARVLIEYYADILDVYNNPDALPVLARVCRMSTEGIYGHLRKALSAVAGIANEEALAILQFAATNHHDEGIREEAQSYIGYVQQKVNEKRKCLPG